MKIPIEITLTYPFVNQLIDRVDLNYICLNLAQILENLVQIWVDTIDLSA